jgi:EF hand domain-containing protein
MKRFSIPVALIFLVLAAGLSAGQNRVAQERQGRHPNFDRLLKRIDADGDGRISKEEWNKRSQLFDRIDQNHDGFLTRDETRTAMRERAEKRQERRVRGFETLDKNHDGQISREEWPRRMEVFDRLDSNHDGVLSREELAAGRRPDKRRR